MKITGLVISTLFTSDTKAIESRCNIDNVFVDDAIRPTFKETFLLELTRNLIALKDQGATITIVPVINYSDEDWDIWEQLNNDSRYTVLTFLKNRQKIHAIREVRAQTGLDLREAKRFIGSKWVLEKLASFPCIL
jgi:ribosomal protein L7/L12